MLYVAPLRNRISTNSSAIGSFGKHSPEGVQGVQGTHLIDAGVRDVVFLEKGTKTSSMTICSPQLSLKTPALPTQARERLQHLLVPCRKAPMQAKPCLKGVPPLVQLPVQWQTPTLLHSWELKCTGLGIKLD